MIKRPDYLEQIINFIDKPFVKILTGIRRSGKSTLMLFIRDELINRGVNEKQIIYINFESFEFSFLEKASDLYNFIENKISENLRTYILLDEIQEVKGWEKAINSIMVDFNCDIFLTGSNSKLLSSELATYLAGRYVSFHINTLSFSEYLTFKEYRTQQTPQNIYKEFDFYLRMGGFPALHLFDYTFEMAYKAVYDIYSSVILRDTVQRFNIRNMELLERVVKYIFDNIGNSFSAKKIADYFKSQQRKIDLNTVYNYLHALESSFLISQVRRFDVKGKEILKTQEKYFVSDLSLIYAVMGFKDRMISGLLENIIFLELQKRGYKVFIGKSGDKEIDFVAEKKGNKVYIQVAYLLPESKTIQREFDPLLNINDHYPKYVVTMDRSWSENMNGIKHRHIADFLLMREY